MVGLTMEELQRALSSWITEQAKSMPDIIHFLPAGERPAFDKEDRGAMLIPTPKANYVVPNDSTGLVAIRALLAMIDANNRRITQQLRHLGFEV